MNDPAFTVAVVALILALTALGGFVGLCISFIRSLRGPDPEPRPWVNDGPCRPRPRKGDWRERCNT
jgi:hypothetical protein